MYELPEIGRDVPKHLGILKVHALNVCVCDVCFELVLWMNIKYNARNE
jgi:hypothetical protein